MGNGGRSLEPWDAAEPATSELPELTLPVRIHDQVLGTIQAHKTDGTQEWTAEEIELMRTLSDQLSVALESARLYGETQRRAAQEQLTGQITARIRETLDVDTVLQTAAREIGEALGLYDLTITLDVDEDGTDEVTSQPVQEVS